MYRSYTVHESVHIASSDRIGLALPALPMNCHTSGSRSPDGNGNPSRVAALSFALWVPDFLLCPGKKNAGPYKARACFVIFDVVWCYLVLDVRLLSSPFPPSVHMCNKAKCVNLEKTWHHLRGNMAAKSLTGTCFCFKETMRRVTSLELLPDFEDAQYGTKHLRTWECNSTKGVGSITILVGAISVISRLFPTYHFPMVFLCLLVKVVETPWSPSQVPGIPKSFTMDPNPKRSDTFKLYHN